LKMGYLACDKFLPGIVLWGKRPAFADPVEKIIPRQCAVEVGNQNAHRFARRPRDRDHSFRCLPRLVCERGVFPVSLNPKATSRTVRHFCLDFSYHSRRRL